eukprot:NODE_6171_length_1698_cov_24.518141.p1 GENE.NODE_6171_length_1698_cov_24.518141~~NODE_6171_length_1698_cov_24.518141.p1  ORF type:complete len:489 (+),score=124.13 NODE_6171_length_1698_cov_24.518141:131-1468(+)
MEPEQSIEVALDATWTMVAAFLVMFMQAGFTLLEAGSVSAKNVINILEKNLLDICVGAFCWWVLGYGFAFGEDYGKFIGTSLFSSRHKDFKLQSDENGSVTFHYLTFFFQWAFCATAATIVSGAVASRCSLTAYVIFSTTMTLVIYPIVVHWTWGGGFLSDLGYIDFAGSGIVHMVGGFAGLVGAAILGPRNGRFDPGQEDNFRPHSMPFIVLGTTILWFGWYGFNAGSTVAMSGGAAGDAALVAVTTTMAATAGGMTAFLTQYAATQKNDVVAIANGILAGLVSITAPCAGVYPYAALIIGMIGGWIYLGASALLKKLKIDDPLDAFPVHGACGAWGVLATALFDFKEGLFFRNMEGDAERSAGKVLGTQLLAIVCIVGWTSALSLLIFGSLRATGSLRVTLAKELEGLDGANHAYNFGKPVTEAETSSPTSQEADPELSPFDV